MDYSQYYRDWLGMEVSSNTTPNHYELFGLPALESSKETIQEAVNQGLERVKRVDFTGKVGIYQDVLSQVIEAKLTLLNPVLKQDYDKVLLAAGKKRIWRDDYERPSLGVRARQFSAVTLAFAMGVGIAFVMWSTAPRNPDGSINYNVKRTTLAQVVPLTTVPGTDYPRPNSRSRRVESTEPKVDSMKEEETVPSTDSLESKEPAQTMVSEPKETVVAAVSPEPNDEIKDDSSETVARIKPTTSTRNRDRLRKMFQGRQPSGQSEVVTNVLPAEETPAMTQLPSVLPELPSLEDGRKSRPTEEMLATIQKNVQDVLKSYEKMSDAESAKQLLQDAESNENALLRYALLQTSLEKAVAVGDSQTAMNVLGVMNKGYDIPLLTMQQMTLDELCTVVAKSGESGKERFMDLYRAAIRVCTYTSDDHQYDRASTMWNRVYTMGTQSNDVVPEVKEELQKRQNYYATLSKMYKGYQDSIEILKTEPKNEDANRRVGLWYCQVEHNMAKAIPHFAQCDRPHLRIPAQMELENDKTPASLLKTADQWWDCSHRVPYPLNQVLSNHAISLYETIDQNRLEKGEQIRVVERIEKQRK